MVKVALIRLVALAACLFAWFCAPAMAADALFVQTNAPNGDNAVRVLVGGKGGKLASAGSFRTGGSGTGKEIASEGTLALTRNRRYLAVLDVGSSAVTVFRVGRGRLERTDRIASGGRHPVSIASGPNNRFVVLNARGTSNLAGFKVRRKSGELVALPRLSAPLSEDGAGAYEVAVSASGKRAAVSYAKAKGGNDLELFRVAGGRLRSAGVAAVQGGRPSPISFLRNDRLLVGRMGPGGPGLATYGVGQGLDSLSTLGIIVCWIETNDAGTLGWATFPSSVHSFGIGSSGKLSERRSKQLRGRSSDLTLGAKGRRLYVLNKRNGRVRVLALNPKKLTVLDASRRLPGTTTGIVDLPNNIGGFST